MYSYFNNVNNNDFSLQSECMLFAVPLHTVCSVTANPLQSRCKAVAVSLQIGMQ